MKKALEIEQDNDTFVNPDSNDPEANTNNQIDSSIAANP